MKNKKMLAIAFTAALLLPVCAGIGRAYAYFTDHVAASGGGYVMEIGKPDTELKETFGSWTKHVTVKNTGEIPVYVRVKAFCGNEYHLEFKENGNWKAGDDGYYYYIGESDSGAGVLKVQEETPPNLDIEIRLNQKGTDENGKEYYLPIPGNPDNQGNPAENRVDFNVVVVCERTPLQYDENGDLLAPDAADWELYKPGAWPEEGGEVK